MPRPRSARSPVRPARSPGSMTAASDVRDVRGHVEAPIASLKTGNGLRDKDMMKAMDADSFPTMRFELHGVSLQHEAGDSAVVSLSGQLTLHGVTRDVAVPAARSLREGRRAGDRVLSAPRPRLRRDAALEDAGRLQDESRHRGADRRRVRTRRGAVTRSRPSRDATTVRLIPPRTSSNLPFANPIVMPAGAKTVRAGPDNVTPSSAGPGARHTSVESPLERTQTSIRSALVWSTVRDEPSSGGKPRALIGRDDARARGVRPSCGRAATTFSAP